MVIQVTFDYEDFQNTNIRKMLFERSTQVESKLTRDLPNGLRTSIFVNKN